MVNLQDYIHESDLFKTIRIDDLLLVDYRCLIGDRESEIWNHTNYLAYVVGGEKKWITPTNECKIGPGEALFVKKGAHTVYQYFDEPFFVLFIFIPDEFIRKVILKYPELASHTLNGHQEEQLISLSMNKVLDSFFQSVMAFFSKDATCSESVLKMKMEELILNILTQPNNHQLKRYFFSVGKNQKVNLKEIMNDNFIHQLSLNDFARMAARSLSTFRRDFKNAYGTTPGKWLLAKRLEYGKFLLETTDKSINEIIDTSGFKNRSHFIKSFKDAFGVSPRKFRSENVEAID